MKLNNTLLKITLIILLLIISFTFSVQNTYAGIQPFGTVTLNPDFRLNGAGSDVDTIAFYEAPNPSDTLMFTTAKASQLVEVWKYPFVNNEQTPLRNTDCFGTSGTRVNGVAVDQDKDLLHVAISAPKSKVCVFSLPSLTFIRSYINGAHDLRSEPNIGLLKHSNGQVLSYVSADNIVYIYNADTGIKIGQFNTTKGVETVHADNLYQKLYIPDESTKTGVYIYNPDGTASSPVANFGNGHFQLDEEGTWLYTCPSNGAGDSGEGLIMVSDQKSDQTDFEFFNRKTYQHLGIFRLTGVSNTDGIASTQKALQAYPLGLFTAINNDTETVGIGWDKIFNATGLSCPENTNPSPTPQQSFLCDIDGDGCCRLPEYSAVLSDFAPQIRKPTALGDLNNDEYVNLTDYSIALADFGKCRTP